MAAREIIKFGGVLTGVTAILGGSQVFIGISTQCAETPACVTGSAALGLAAIAFGAAVTYVFAKK